MNRVEEFKLKRARLERLMEDRGLDAVVIETTHNFAWLTCGGSNYVGTASVTGNAAAVITRNENWIVCDNIEEPRIHDEEVEDLGFNITSYPWFKIRKDEVINEITNNGRLGSDSQIPGSLDISSGLDRCRIPLLQPEIDRYRRLGEATGRIIGQTARNVKPGMTENQVMGMLNGMLVSEGIVPTCTLAAADERISRYRHPLPTDNPVRKMVMIITGARKWGLVASTTRIVHFGELSEDLIKRHRAVAYIDAQFIAATRPGNTVGNIFKCGQKAYAAAGYDNEWHLHHQGGLTGYKSREFRAIPESLFPVEADTAYAWNPSITGTKSEDTILVGKTSNEILTQSPDWPLIECSTVCGSIYRPDILIL